MVENRTTFVQKEIHAELDATLHYPPQGTVVVVRGVVHQEWVVEPIGVYRELRGYTVNGLECLPNILQAERFTLPSNKRLDKGCILD